MRFSVWISDVCSSDLTTNQAQFRLSSEAPVRVSLPAPGWVKLCAIVDIRCLPSLFALPEQAQQQLEQVDKVEVERQRAHHRQLVGAFAARIGQVLALQQIGRAHV